MPLRIKCSHCRKTLVVDEAFMGLRARCGRCRGVLEIPMDPKRAPARPAQRPARPRLASERPVKTRVKSRAALDTASGWTAVLRTRTALAAMVAFGVVLIGAVSWTLIGGSPESTRDQLASGTASETIERLEERGALPVFLARVTPEQLKSQFIGVALRGDVVGIVVDRDPTMASYMQPVADIANALSNAQRGERRLGILRARTGEPDRVAFSPTNALLPMKHAEPTLRVQPIKDQTDLGQTLGIAAEWHADQLFLVLAKPLASGEIEALSSQARETGAVMHVVGLGAAAQTDLTPIAQATGGSFIPLTDAELEAVAAHYRKLAA